MGNSLEIYVSPKLHEQVLVKYNQLFSLFQPLLGKSKKIVEIKRGLILKGKENIFWDYLSSTHSKAEENNGALEGIRCIQLTFADGEEFIFSHHSSQEARLEGLLCLDDLFLQLNKDSKKKATSLLSELTALEYQHFNPDSFKKQYSCKIAETFYKTKGKGD